MGDSCGPVWAVDTEEMGLGVLLLLAIVAIPYIPVGVFAYWLGQMIWDVKIVKWGIVLLFVVAWHIFLIVLKEKKGLLHMVGAILVSWLIFDFANAGWHWEKMFFPRLGMDAIHWLFSA